MHNKAQRAIGLGSCILALYLFLHKGDSIYLWVINSEDGRILTCISCVFVVSISLFVFVRPKSLFKFLFDHTTPSNASLIYGTSLICGGLIILLTLLENHSINRINTETNRINTEANLLNNKMNQITSKGNLDSRFNYAITLFSNKESISILAGIYALNEVAIEASSIEINQPQYPKIIHDVLCAFLRENSIQHNNKLNPTISKSIVEILWGTSHNIYSEYHSDLSGVVLENFELDSIYFINTNLDNALFRNISIGNNIEYNINSLVKLPSKQLNNITFEQVEISNAQLTDINFSGATFTKCRFNDSKIHNSNFHGCVFENTDFMRCEISYTSFSIKEPYFFHEEVASSKEFDACNLINVNFHRNNIIHTNFSHSNLNKVTFDYSNLKFIQFVKTELNSVDFTLTKELDCETIDFSETELNCSTLKLTKNKSHEESIP